MAQKYIKKVVPGAPETWSWNRLPSIIVFGLILGTIFVDLGLIFMIFNRILHHFGSIYDKFLADHFDIGHAIRGQLCPLSQYFGVLCHQKQGFEKMPRAAKN